jgi:hypothetical protein
MAREFIMLLRRLLEIVAGTLLISQLFLPLLCRAEGQELDEYQVKAGFVASFVRFVEWPAEAFTSPQEPFAICVLGRNPFGQALAALLAGKSVGDRPIVLREIADTAGAAGCRIVFICSSEHLRVRAILKNIKETGVFTIGDTGDFTAEGGVASLVVDSGKVRIDLNVTAAKEKNLRISARLLQVARVVK